MKLTTLYFEAIPWKQVGAFVLVLVFCAMAFYKEGFLVGKNEKAYFQRLSKKSNTNLSGRTIVAILGGVLLIASLLIGYFIYLKN